jgi:thiamine pyrophosphate-dependent acetolactate synthase large subunit-like protein
VVSDASFAIGVDRPADLAGALGEAFAAGGPVLVDVRVDEWQTPELALRKRLGALQERLAQLGVKR